MLHQRVPGLASIFHSRVGSFLGATVHCHSRVGSFLGATVNSYSRRLGLDCHQGEGEHRGQQLLKRFLAEPEYPPMAINPQKLLHFTILEPGHQHRISPLGIGDALLQHFLVAYHQLDQCYTPCCLDIALGKVKERIGHDPAQQPLVDQASAAADMIRVVG